jgi:hypothetical protein
MGNSAVLGELIGFGSLPVDLNFGWVFSFEMYYSHSYCNFGTLHSTVVKWAIQVGNGGRAKIF